MITSRQKVWSALRGEPTNHIPKGEILITDDIIGLFPQPTLEGVLDYLGADLVTLPLENFTDKDFRGKWLSQPFFTFGMLQGPFTLAVNKIGWTSCMRLLKNNPKEVMSVMDTMIEECLPRAYQALDHGLDGILVADDLAGKTGLFVSPLFLEKHYFPLLTKMLRQLNYRHIPFLFHSDGQILQIIPALKEAGFWGIQSLQPSSGLNAKCFTPDPHWVYWGNFEFEDFNRIKTTEELIRDVNLILQEWSGFSGYIFGSSGGLYKGLPPEAIKAAYQAVTHWRNYPDNKF